MAPQPKHQDVQRGWPLSPAPRTLEALLVVDWQAQQVSFSGDFSSLGLFIAEVSSPARLQDLAPPVFARLRSLPRSQGTREVLRLPSPVGGEGAPELELEILPAPSLGGSSTHWAILVRQTRLHEASSDSPPDGPPMDFALFSAMAHEIKNSLVAIKTLVELLLEKDPNLEMARIVRQEVDRIASIVTQMLSTSASLEKRGETLSLHSVVDQVIQIVGPLAQARQMRLDRSLTAPVDQIRADRRQLEQAILNVAMNGLEAMTPGGTLRLRTRIDQGSSGASEPSTNATSRTLILSIEDTGCGISPEAMARLYEDFFTTKSRGSGLGLSIARRVMEAHGGSIRVHSEAGVGTRFDLIFPA